MQHPGQLRIGDFRYELPDERIARYPLAVRDASRLLIYRDGNISEDTYRHLASHIPADSLVVFNQTKVVHARLLFQKDTGGIIEVFCLEPDKRYSGVAAAMLQRGKVWWQCMIGGASKWKHGQVLSQYFPAGKFTLSAAVVERRTGSFTLELSWDDPSLSFAEVLHEAGKVPLPPYLHREAEASDEERYQTIYARAEGSVAAPTAGLHFTDAVLQSLAAKNIDQEFITLHVGAGTFKPVKSQTMEDHEMHAEWIELTKENLAMLMAHQGKGIIAVGTTSLRTLESLYWIGTKLLWGDIPDFTQVAVKQWDPYEEERKLPDAGNALQAVYNFMVQEGVEKLVTKTQIIIAPGYEMKIVNALVTNFHQPESTLLLLVAALIGDDWRKVYDYALQHEFRFLSYGDGSLLWAQDKASFFK